MHGRIHPADVGACQINAEVWQDKADELGLDLDTWNGNVTMANYIYKTSGTKPWNSSRACWKN